MAMFWQMLAIVRLDRSTMAVTSATPPCSTAAASSATTLPPPISISTSASAREAQCGVTHDRYLRHSLEKLIGALIHVQVLPSWRSRL